MNNTRRKQIQEIIDKLEELKSDVEMLKDEEQEAFDNLPEGIQASERGEAMETAAYNLEEAYDYMDSVIDSLTESIEQ